MSVLAWLIGEDRELAEVKRQERAREALLAMWERQYQARKGEEDGL